MAPSDNSQLTKKKVKLNQINYLTRRQGTELYSIYRVATTTHSVARRSGGEVQCLIGRLDSLWWFHSIMEMMWRQGPGNSNRR